jgi:hypothetical protein
MSRIHATLLATLMLASAPTLAQTLESGERAAVLIELYTSEGCNSCPPADRWLRSLSERDELWREYVPVAFHVDYWDHIGWADRFARPEFGQRQRRYARSGAARGVYTPGVFAQGREWHGWREGRVPELDLEDPGVLALSIEREGMSLDYHPSRLGEADMLSANIALLAFDRRSDVRAGENRGRTLVHGFLVLEWLEAPLIGAGPSLKAAFPSFTNECDGRCAVVGWVNRSDQRPIQAVGGWREP